MGKDRKIKTLSSIRHVQHIRETFGFHWSDFRSFDAFSKMAHRPMEPYGLAVIRIIFGVLMIIDIFGENGAINADLRWGSPENKCFFPLFNFLHPLPLKWMMCLYMMMFTVMICITLGCFYRMSCLIFAASYWYIFWLDKTRWNNLSYLYGLFSIILLVIDGNRAWSVDGYIWPEIRNSHVPAWNYGLFRFQIMLAYFIAALKKITPDWYYGYSVDRKTLPWIFTAFRLFLSEEKITLVIRIGGLFVDIWVGWFLYFNATRLLGLTIAILFNLISSQNITIDMFPWMMVATMSIFCAPDWPITLMKKLPPKFQFATIDTQMSHHCVYEKSVIKSENNPVGKNNEKKNKNFKSSPGFYHRYASIFLIVYGSIQLVLPYTHFITKGYNNWEEGLYGYSWNMEQNWAAHHVRIKYLDKTNRKIGYIDPYVWTDRKQARWSSYADMLKQYALCAKDKLYINYNITDVEIYADVWKSLNGRFHQRMFDHRVDLVKANWNPFKQTEWVLPLLTELDGWRNDMKRIEKYITDNTHFTSFVFFADIPDLVFENYAQENLWFTTLHVLKGVVAVELWDQVTTAGGLPRQIKRNVTIFENQEIQLSPGFHNVYVISWKPACYMYKFRNRTSEIIKQNIAEYKWNHARAKREGIDEATFNSGYSPEDLKFYESELSKSKNILLGAFDTSTLTTKIRNQIIGLYKLMLMSRSAIESIVGRKLMIQSLKENNVTEKTMWLGDSLSYWLP